MKNLPESPRQTGDIWFVLIFAAFMSAMYVLLYRLSDFIAGNEFVGGVVSIIFLPAFIRLLGFLVIRWWIVPALFISGLFCVDLGLGMGARMIVSIAIALGAPLGIFLTAKATGLNPELSDLSATQLLQLSFGCAVGNALFYNSAVAMVGASGNKNFLIFEIFLGDVIGTWTMILMVKWLLTLSGRLLRT